MKKDSHITWLVSCPPTDINFKTHLRQATAAEIEKAISIVERRGPAKTKIKALEGELRRRAKAANSSKERSICREADI